VPKAKHSQTVTRLNSHLVYCKPQSQEHTVDFVNKNAVSKYFSYCLLQGGYRSCWWANESSASYRGPSPTLTFPSFSFPPLSSLPSPLPSFLPSLPSFPCPSLNGQVRGYSSQKKFRNATLLLVNFSTFCGKLYCFWWRVSSKPLENTCEWPIPYFIVQAYSHLGLWPRLCTKARSPIGAPCQIHKGARAQHLKLRRGCLSKRNKFP